MSFQQKNSLLCPNCRRLISRSEDKCPHCGLGKPGSWLKNNRLTASFSHPDQLLQTIIYVNIGMFILSILLNPGRTNFNINPFGFLSPSNQSLLLLGSTGTIPILQLNRWWTLISANYLHGGLLHILFNMMALRQVGHLVVHEYGGSRMFAIYTIGGVLGFFVSFLAGVPFTIGASAALCSLIGALLYYGKSRGGVYGQAVYKQIGSWAVFIFIFGLIVPGINNWGHGGGMLAGAVLAYLLGYRERKRETPGHRTLALACGLVTALVLVWACSTSLFYILMR